MLLFRLAEGQRRTVAELLTGQAGPLSCAEMMLWARYRREFGLAGDRLEYGVALSGLATARAMGAKKLKLDDLIPDFRPRRTGLTGQSLAAALAGFSGVKVDRWEK